MTANTTENTTGAGRNAAARKNVYLHFEYGFAVIRDCKTHDDLFHLSDRREYSDHYRHAKFAAKYWGWELV